MKKYLFIILFLFPNFVAFSQNSIEIIEESKNKEFKLVTISAEPALRFYNLMNYLENKSNQGFNYKQVDRQSRRDNYKANINDKKIQEMIDSLLSLPVYEAISEVSRIYNKYGISVKKGKKTYRDAFNNLPIYCVAMNAGRPYTWVEYWIKDYKKEMFTIVDYVQKNGNKIIEYSIQQSKQLLPAECNLNIGVDVFIVFDGNRGSFQKNNMIILDLMNKNLYDTVTFQNVLTHEFHHRYYGEWLDKKLSGKKRDNKHKILLMLQESFLMEGVAQQYTISSYNNQALELLYNRELMKEINDEWISSIREINASSFPKMSSVRIIRKQHSKEMQWLNNYCSKPVENETVQYRPSVIYYLSYHIYNSILEKKGLKGLFYVIENPDKLLSEYNSIYSEDLLIPMIPEDIVKLWANNLE